MNRLNSVYCIEVLREQSRKNPNKAMSVNEVVRKINNWYAGMDDKENNVISYDTVKRILVDLMDPRLSNAFTFTLEWYITTNTGDLSPIAWKETFSRKYLVRLVEKR